MREQAPFGIGGGWDISVIWCDKCKKMYVKNKLN